jgi:hypothetical protein
LRGLLALLGGVLSSAADAGDLAKPVDFARDLRPVLSGKCFACHGPDAKKRKARLRLDTRDGVFRVEDGVAVTVGGKPEESALYTRLVAKDPSEIMPPPESGKSLGPGDVELVRRWIEEGASWKEHWAYVAPVAVEPPPVAREAWCRGEIDRFVLARLEAAGLEPEGDADRSSLARRVTFDLTGLPPSPEEVDAFVQDAGSDAYERLVDRLLRSAHYGEHMARFWLDAARYGDTHGLHLDNLRVMWPYRDWVIRAFNENLPYDRFVVEQLAGDMLPDATLEQQVASGFNRCHVTTSEGGVIEEEVYVRNVSDRVDTVGTVFLGTTATCATCHDHKYDPMTQRDYYQLFAIFNSLDESPLDGNAAVYPPVVRVATEEQLAAVAALRREMAGVEEAVRGKLASLPYEEPPAEKRMSPPPSEVVWIDDDLPPGNVHTPLEWIEKPVLSGKRAFSRTAGGLEQYVIDGLKEPLVVTAGDGLFAHVYLDPQNPPAEIMLQWHDGSWEHRVYWGEDRIEWGTKDTPSRRRAGELPETGKWVRLEVAAADVALAPGARIGGWAFTQFGGTVHWDRAGIATRDPARLAFDSYLAWQDALRAAQATSLPPELEAVLKKDAGARSAEEERRLRDRFLEHAWSGSRAVFAPLHAQLADLRRRIEDVEKEFPTTLVSKERAEPRESFILKRGEYDKRGEKVGRGTPAFLPPLGEDQPPDRLGFARWLVDPSHPLTARVAVNRLWQQVFGTGLVKTAEDFGSQGDPPSHPELLDWLAGELVRSGWDVKALVRRMVLSSAYRQSARTTPERLARDPENRLLSRGPRYRLDAEMIRDQSLAASGLLVRTIGGPSVKPPQPAGLWEAVGYTSSNTARFSPDTGDKVHRRSLYTFWKRTSPPPQMTSFDAPSREACRVRRERTNTPLQALQLMNEEQQVEAARCLAERVLREVGPSPEERAARLFRLVVGRPPEAADLADLLGLYRAQLAEFEKDPAAAALLLKVGEAPLDATRSPVELAAWTMVGNLVLNLDEAVCKG